MASLESEKKALESKVAELRSKVEVRLGLTGHLLQGYLHRAKQMTILHPTLFAFTQMIEKREAERKALEDKKRKEELDFLRYQGQHLDAFMKQVSGSK